VQLRHEHRNVCWIGLEVAALGAMGEGDQPGADRRAAPKPPLLAHYQTGDVVNLAAAALTPILQHGDQRIGQRPTGEHLILAQVSGGITYREIAELEVCVSEPFSHA
jgi:hypothetical protein